MFKAGTLDATKQLIETFVERVTVFSNYIQVKYASASFVINDESTIIEHRIAINDVRHYKKKVHQSDCFRFLASVYAPKYKKKIKIGNKILFLN